ncbi:unnamed protein product [Alopecurus aequalis]
MAGGNLFSRALGYVVNQFLVESLANKRLHPQQPLLREGSPVSSDMAGGANLFSKALSYVVNEFLVEGLANNRAFQRFAVRTNRTFETLSSKAKEVKQEVSEKWSDVRGQDDHFKH